MPKIKNMGSATARFNEGIIVSGSAANNEALIVTGSAILVGNLHISGSDQEGIRIGKGGSEYRQIVFETDGDDGAIIQLTNAEHLAIFAEENKDTIFYSKESGDGSYLERARIKNTGKVGIGKSDPSYKLHVYDDVSDYVAIIDNDQSSSGHGLKVTSDGTGSGTNLLDVESASTTLFRVRGDGRVGIGKVSSLPAAVLTVSSSNSDSDLAIAHKIHHIGDADTSIAFDVDKISFETGGSTELEIDGDALTVGGALSLKEQATVPGHTTNFGKIYVKVSDSKLYFKNDSGTEYDLTSGGGGGGGSGDNLSVTSPKTSNYTAANWEFVLVNLAGASGDVTVTLPAASADKQVAIKINSLAMGKEVIVDGNGSETIDGLTTRILNTDYESMHLISDGNAWWRIS